MRPGRRHWTPLACGLAGLLIGGCSLAGMTGDMMAEYSTEHLQPYVMATGDTGMACAMGEAMGAYQMSFGRVTDAPHIASVATLVSAGSCAEIDAWAHQLRGLRAVKAGAAAEALDARIAEKRAHAIAARRFYGAYQEMVAAFGVPGDACPDLSAPGAETAFLFGITAGLQAVQHDRAASGIIDVPLDVPRRAARASECLNNERWWGVPKALQAAVWTGVPGATPKGADPWAQLAASAAIGERAGVRLASVILAQSAMAAGKEDQAKAAITAFVASREKTPASKEWRLLDLNALDQMQALSDTLWTRDTGHRTPNAALGTFYEAPQADTDDGGLLEGLD